MNDFHDMNDEGLVALAQAGNHQAFAHIVRRHTGLFYSAAYRMVSDVTEAEDIVQESFLKFWNKPQNFDASKGVKFTTWFYRVVTNTALDALRKKKPQSASDVLDQFEDRADGAQAQMEAVQEEEVLEHAIQSLPERQRVALNLCFYEGLSNKEAAAVLDVKVKALESLLMRAKAGLRDILSRQGVLEMKNAG